MARSREPSAFDGALLRALATVRVSDVKARTLEDWRRVGGIEPPVGPGGRRAYGFLPASAIPLEYLERVIAFRELVREQDLRLQPAVLIMAARGYPVEPPKLRQALESLASYLAIYGHERGAKTRRGPSAWRTIEQDLRASGFGDDADELTTDARRRMQRPTVDLWVTGYWRPRVAGMATELVSRATDEQLVVALAEGRRRALLLGEGEARAIVHALGVLAGDGGVSADEVRAALSAT
jgi:hypothetical protein